MLAPTALPLYLSGEHWLPVKAAEDFTMSASINSMDWGSRLASFIFGTAAMQVSHPEREDKDTSHIGFGISFMVISVMMPRVPLRAYHQVQQAVSGAGLVTVLPSFMISPEGQDHGHSQNIVAGDAILTARMPPALVETLPPTVAVFAGIGGYIRP